MADKNRDALLLGAAGLGGLLAARVALRRWRNYDLENRVAIITGGSRGLGLVLAREFARQGARVAICARDEEELTRAREDLARRRADVLAVECDVTDRGAVRDMVARVKQHFTRIDILVNNAGVIQVGPMEVMTVEDYEEAMKTHFWGPLYTILEVLPEMQRLRGGRIANISSIGGKISVPHLLPYSASKFALTGLSEGFCAELAKDNILVTTVCPGLMRTGSPRNAIFKGRHRAEYAWFAISDSLPFASMKAERAARKIISAIRRGESEAIIPIQAQMAVKFHGLFPGLTSDLMKIANRFVLPGPGGIGSRRARGKDSQSPVAPSVLTTLTERAAARNNE